MTDDRISLAEADQLAQWLGNVRSEIERRAYRGNPDGARLWVARWLPRILQTYAMGATPAEAIMAVPTALRLPK